MKIFIAGASGVIGRRLVPLLISRGHDVVGTTRTSGKVAALRALGAQPVVLDALDRDAVRRALVEARPDVVIDELTAIAGVRDFRKMDVAFAATNTLRTTGTDHLIEGIRGLPVRRIVAQSFAGPGLFARTGGMVKTEDDPLDPNPPPALRAIVDAVMHLERTVLHIDGVEGTVLRYGGLYGPGTSMGVGGFQLEAVRRRQFPVVGRGTGVSSFVHIDDAAAATVAAVESARTGLYNIVDDEPAAVAEWLPFLAESIGARPPLHVPVWLARLLAGRHGVVMMTESRGASNTRARRELGWQLAYPSWRIGFRGGLGAEVGRPEAARAA
jgi:nucleoside-diphosphate-sugar epimerase